MPKIEIEEADLAAFRNIQKFVDTAFADPKTRKQMLRVQKTLNPAAVVPEIDAEDAVAESAKGVVERVDAALKKLDDRAAADEEARRTAGHTAKIESGRTLLKNAGYNADGIEKIEKLMLDEGIASYGAGLAFFERLNPPPKPADASSRFGSLSDQNVDPASEDFKELFDSQGHSENWLQNSLARVRAEFRN